MAEWPGQAQGDPVGPLRDECSGRPWGVARPQAHVPVPSRRLGFMVMSPCGKTKRLAKSGKVRGV